MCQDEDENEDENQSFGSFWNLCVTNEPIFQYIIALLRAWFVRHRFYPERTKTFVCGFVFVLAHEQPISNIKEKKPQKKLVKSATLGSSCVKYIVSLSRKYT